MSCLLKNLPVKESESLLIAEVSLDGWPNHYSTSHVTAGVAMVSLQSQLPAMKICCVFFELQRFSHPSPQERESLEKPTDCSLHIISPPKSPLNKKGKQNTPKQAKNNHTQNNTKTTSIAKKIQSQTNHQPPNSSLFPSFPPSKPPPKKKKKRFCLFTALSPQGGPRGDDVHPQTAQRQPAVHRVGVQLGALGRPAGDVALVARRGELELQVGG